MLNETYPLGVRSLIVLLGDPDGGAATLAGCQKYMRESGLENDDRVVFALDPNGSGLGYYDGYAQTSVSVISDRTSRIKFKEAFTSAAPVVFHVKLELQRFFEELASEN